MNNKGMIPKLSPAENKIIVFLLLVVAALIFILIEDPLINDTKGTQQPRIGRIQRIQNDSRYKISSRFSWVPAMEGQAVYNQDTVFSGQNSEMEIALEDKGKIHIGSETMIKLELLREIPSLVFNFGSLTAEVGNGRLQVKAGEETYEVAGKDLSLQIVQKRDQKEPQFIVLKGSAEIKSSRGQTVPPVPKPTPEPAAVASPVPSPTLEPSPAPVALITPAPTMTPAPQALKKKIPAKALAPKTTPTPLPEKLVVTPPPPPPTPSPVTVVTPVPTVPPEPAAPQLKEPFDEASYKIKRNGVSYIDFAWSPCAECKLYELQISESTGFEKGLLSFRSEKASFNLQKQLSLKTYYWRVRGLRSGSDPATAWSGPRSFVLYNPSAK